MKVSLLRTFQFEAAHENRSPGASDRTRRLHGHSYEVTVCVAGDVDGTLGWLVDFADINANCRPVIDQLDHRILNDVDGMRDGTVPDVETWLRPRLQSAQNGFDHCVVRVIGDTSLRPQSVVEGTRARVTFGFAAAHYLPHLPASHKCRRMHGHSYRVDVTAQSAKIILDALDSLYPLVDHRELNRIPGLENPTAEHLSRWLWDALRGRGARPEEVLVKETCASACLYKGEED